MAPTPPNKSKKYPLILAAGKKLMWKYGIRKVSIEEISKEAGVSKMTFYRLFENKYKLAEAILEAEFVVNMKKYKDLMAEDISYSQKIQRIIQMKTEGTSDISSEMVNDILTMDDPGLKQVIQKQRMASMTEWMKDMETAKENGWVRSEIKPEFFLAMQGKISEMIMDENFMQMFPDRATAISQITRFFFWGIAGHPDEA